MRRNILLIIFLIFCIPFLLGAIDSHGGFAFLTKTKTDTCEGTGADPRATETDTVVWTPGTGSRIVLMGIKFTSDTANTLLVESGSTAVIPVTECSASGLIVIQGSTPLWQGAANETLTYTIPAESRHSIMMWGYEMSGTLSGE